MNSGLRSLFLFESNLTQLALVERITLDKVEPAYLSPFRSESMSKALLFSKMNLSKLSIPFWCGACSTNSEKPSVRSKSKLTLSFGGITVGFDDLSKKAQKYLQVYP